MSAVKTLAAAKRGSVQVGDELCVVIADTQEQVDEFLAETIAKGLRTGEVIKRSGGTREWIREETDWANGGDFVWDKSGKGVRVLRFHVTETPDGVRTEKRIRPVYRNYVNV